MFANKANDECKHCYVHRVLKIIGFDCRGGNFPLYNIQYIYSGPKIYTPIVKSKLLITD